MDRQLDRIRVLELVDEDMVDLLGNSRLPAQKTLLDRGEVHDALRLEVVEPPVMQFDEITGDSARARPGLDAVRLSLLAAPWNPRFGVLVQQCADVLDPVHVAARPPISLPWRTE